MTLKAVLDWANQDSTEDLNSRFQALFTRGVISGGTITPISGQLKISLQPFGAMSYDGMLVTNDAATSIDIIPDQTNIIAVYAKHLIGDPAEIEISSIEASVFSGLSDRDYYTVFGAVTTLSPATEVIDTDISYSLREMQDKRTRDKLRGQVGSVAELPADPNFNVYGDMYVVFVGIGSAPNIYAWDGVNWGNITGTAAVAIALDKHQNNLDTDLYTGEAVYEIGRLHLSNYQKNAALGSYGIPSAVNRYITQTDPRIPTTDQSDALQGSDGSPSATNKYVTEEYPIAAPTILSNGSPVLTLINMSLQGPVYVGHGVVDTANVYFSILHFTENRGYLNSSGLPCKINAVYKSVTPTFVKLNPSTDILVDANGFYNGPELYLGVDISVDTSSRLVYGKKKYLNTADHGFPILPTPNYEIISGTLLNTIANIKGRLFDDVVPTAEQNINLRVDIDNLSAYVGSVLETNVIAGNEDFIRLAPPAFSGLFEKNIGIEYTYSFKNSIQSQFEYTKATGLVHYYGAGSLGSVTIGDLFIDAAGNRFEVWAVGTSTVNIKDIGLPTYPAVVKGAYPESVSTIPYACVDGSIITRASGIITFSNTSLVSFNWNSTGGYVEYSSAVTLATVSIGNLFRDGGGTTYLITAVDDPNNRLSLVNLQTGIAPLSISTSVGSYLDGSTWVNYNPRDLLLAEMKLSFGGEFVPIKKLVRKADEFSQPEGQVAFSIVRYDNRLDPRVVFYGSWENYKNDLGETYVRNVDGNSKFLLTGYFEHVFLLMRRRTYTGSISVSINGVVDGVIDPSASNLASSAISGIAGPKYNMVKLNTATMSTSLPSTLTGAVSDATDSLDIFGFVFVRTPSTSFLESGRAFESASVVKRDMWDSTIPIDLTPYQGRGGRLVYAVLDNSYERVTNTLADIDSNGTPNGTWTGTTITITVSGGKLPSYNVKDIIMVYSATEAKMCRIVSLGSSTIVVDTTPSVAGVAVNILHICSTDSNIPFATQEDQIAKYILPDDFINHTPTDMELIHQSDRFVVGPDGVTTLSGEDVLVTNVNVIGSNKAVQIQQGSSGKLRFNILATRMDLLCVNDASATVYVSVNGSPEYVYTITAGAQRRTIFSNARYQSHEITIRALTGNFSIAEIMLFGPKIPEFTTFPNAVADLSQLAKYQPSKYIQTTAPNVYPTGCIFKEASSNLSHINSSSGTGTNWATATDYTKSTYGFYNSTDREGAYVEFYILNTAFELQYITGPDHGRFNVFVDGVDISGVGIVVDSAYNYTLGWVDAYAASYGRKNIGVYGLSAGLHKITAKIATPRAKSGFSSGYKMAFVGYYEGNDNGLMTCGITKYGMYSSVVDLREFNAVDFTPLDSGTQVTEPMSRAAKVNLNIGTTSVVVTLAQPYLDSDYVILPCLVNTVDTYPQFQSLLLTAQSEASFTISWNVPISGGNYSMHYYTRTLDV